MRVTWGLGAVLAVALVLPAAAAARTIEVDIKGDHADTEDGSCALREAVRAANEDVPITGCVAGEPGADLIRVPAGKYTLTIEGEDNGSELGDLDVSSPTTIVGLGKGARIDGGGSEGIGDRLIDLRGGSLTLRNIALQNTSVGDDGGGIRTGNALPLTLRDVQMTGLDAGGPGINGGAISADGPVKIFDSLLAGNNAPFHGAIRSADPLTIRRSTIVDNEASFGTGGVHSTGEATITDSTFVDNRLESETGNQNGAAAAFTTDSTLRNVTVSGNSAFQGGGGLAAYNGAEVALVHVTVANNTADVNEDGTGNGGGLYSENGGHFRLRNTVVADNLDRTPIGDIEPDCAAQVFSFGNNLISDQEGCAIQKALGTPQDLAEGTAPLLRPLADNGGLTETIAIKKGSPLRNKVSRATCDDGEEPAVAVKADQRGAPRSGRCDTGAYEYATCGKRLVTEVGTGARERLAGTAGKDGILGLGGKDKVAGKGGADGLCGNGGKDKLVGKGGSDVLNGGPGKDVCIGGPGKDKAKGCEIERSI